MAKKLVIVESPAKAKTINKYLGNDFKVIASFGHVRDLPSKNGSVDPNADFAMNWEVSLKSKKHLQEIIKEVYNEINSYEFTNQTKYPEILFTNDSNIFIARSS